MSVDNLRSQISLLLDERSQHFASEFAGLREIQSEHGRAIRALIAESDRRYTERFAALSSAAVEADIRYDQRHTTLKEFLQDKIEECERLVKEGDSQLTEIASERNNRYDERARNAEAAVTTGFAAQQAALANAFTSANQANAAAADAHKDVHSANATALALATTEMKEKLQEMNNLRQQITGERATYVTRDVLDARLAALETTGAATAKSNMDRIAALEAARNNWAGVSTGKTEAQTNQHTSNTLLIAVFSAIVAAGGLIAVIEIATRAHP